MWSKNKSAVVKGKVTYLANGANSVSIPEAGPAQRQPAEVKGGTESGQLGATHFKQPDAGCEW